MADPAQVQRIEQEAVATLLDLLRAGGFVRAELFWSVLAGLGSATLTAVDAHGKSAVLETPNVIFETLDELRSEMTDPDAGPGCRRVYAWARAAHPSGTSTGTVGRTGTRRHTSNGPSGT